MKTMTMSLYWIFSLEWNIGGSMGVVVVVTAVSVADVMAVMKWNKKLMGEGKEGRERQGDGEEDRTDREQQSSTYQLL
jgi:hypothetical protein